MAEPRFEWDDTKAASNREKHDVTLNEARAVFLDELALIKPDLMHSETEERQLIVGLSSKHRLIVVCFTERNGAFRVSNARKATKSERRRYEEEAE
jgi:uncharacterized DUF497 family protein